MQHRAVGDRQRQVLRPAAADKMYELQPQDAPGIVNPGAVVDPQVMPFAGDHHVVVAIIAHPGWPPQTAGHHRAGDGKGVALAFLATKATAHAANLDTHRAHRQMKRMGHLVLHFGRVLGGRVDNHAPAFLGNRGSDLSFQVEVFLTADLEGSLNQFQRLGDGPGGIALLPDDWPLFEPAARRQSLIDSQNCRELPVGHLSQPHRLTSRKVGLGNHKEDRLADIVDLSHSEKRFIMRRRAAIGHLGQVLGRQDSQDAGGRADGGEVQIGDLTMCDG